MSTLPASSVRPAASRRVLNRHGRVSQMLVRAAAPWLSLRPQGAGSTEAASTSMKTSAYRVRPDVSRCVPLNDLECVPDSPTQSGGSGPSRYLCNIPLPPEVGWSPSRNSHSGLDLRSVVRAPMPLNRAGLAICGTGSMCFVSAGSVVGRERSTFGAASWESTQIPRRSPACLSAATKNTQEVPLFCRSEVRQMFKKPRQKPAFRGQKRAPYSKRNRIRCPRERAIFPGHSWRPGVGYPRALPRADRRLEWR
jgi:hypothetical protein